MIAVRPVYDAPRRSLRGRLFGVYVDGECVVICTTYPSWIGRK